MKRPLFLYQFVDHLFTVLAVGAIADMHPVVSSLRVFLPDQLIELAMSFNPFEPAFTLLDVAIDAQVSRFTSHMLAVRDTTDGLIECQRPES